MESPESWNVLTASFAICDVKNPLSAWAFAAVQGLVRDDPGDRDLFLRFLEEETARGDVTGPSLPYRVASALSLSGIVLPPGLLPDPWGEIAGARLEAVAPWGAYGRAPLENLRQFKTDVENARLTAQRLSSSSQSKGPDSRKPWWRFI